MTPEKIIIRLMQKQDVKLLCKMIKSLGRFSGDAARGNENDLLAYCFGRKKLSSVLLAFVANKPAGFAITRDWVNLTQGFMARHIDFLFVEEKFRNKGIGVTLMKTIRERAVQDGCDLLDISAGIKNKPANNLYRKLGFEAREMHSIQYRMRLKPQK